MSCFSFKGSVYTLNWLHYSTYDEQPWFDHEKSTRDFSRQNKAQTMRMWEKYKGKRRYHFLRSLRPPALLICCRCVRILYLYWSNLCCRLINTHSLSTPFMLNGFLCAYLHTTALSAWWWKEKVITVFHSCSADSASHRRLINWIWYWLWLSLQAQRHAGAESSSSCSCWRFQHLNEVLDLTVTLKDIISLQQYRCSGIMSHLRNIGLVRSYTVISAFIVVLLYGGPDYKVSFLPNCLSFNMISGFQVALLAPN